MAERPVTTSVSILRYLQDGPQVSPEIAKYVGMGVEAVLYHLFRLRKRGLVRLAADWEWSLVEETSNE